MFTKGKVRIKTRQTWTIGKRTIQLVYELNNVKIGNTVKIIETVGCSSFITVEDILTGTRFDITAQNLGKLIN